MPTIAARVSKAEFDILTRGAEAETNGNKSQFLRRCLQESPRYLEIARQNQGLAGAWVEKRLKRLAQADGHLSVGQQRVLVRMGKLGIGRDPVCLEDLVAFSLTCRGHSGDAAYISRQQMRSCLTSIVAPLILNGVLEVVSRSDRPMESTFALSEKGEQLAHLYSGF